MLKKKGIFREQGEKYSWPEIILVGWLYPWPPTTFQWWTSGHIELIKSPGWDHFFPGGRGRGSSKTWISDVPNYSKKTITSTSDDGYVKILVKICNQWFFCFTWILTMILIILRKGINFLSKNEVLGPSSSKIICKGDIPSFHHISSIDTPCHPKAPQVPLASPDIGAEATHLTWKAHMICWRVVSSSGWRVVAGDQRKGRKKKNESPSVLRKNKKGALVLNKITKSMLYGYIYLLIYQMYDIFYLLIYHICFIGFGMRT